MAHCRYRTKLDMSEAYEQIRIHPDHVAKTAFTTILGTFRSQVIQMGDCNCHNPIPKHYYQFTLPHPILPTCDTSMPLILSSSLEPTHVRMTHHDVSIALPTQA
ncbi:hypothetical protein JB92DRAFT_2823212 [Gautieria morchelliformis]|nr:hypothetical protein JB92DRAFT_2823212 [Gautieria morchelliformis]